MLTKAKINKIAIGRKICDGNGVYFKKTAQNKGQWSYRYIIGHRPSEVANKLSITKETISRWRA